MGLSPLSRTSTAVAGRATVGIFEGTKTNQSAEQQNKLKTVEKRPYLKLQLKWSVLGKKEKKIITKPC